MKKYSSYAVEIIHLNGNRQLREAEDSTSYNSTMSLYREIKDEYIDRIVTINFVGYTKEGDRGILFTKQCTSYNSEKRNIKELIEVIYEASRELQSQLDIVRNKVSIYDKKKSNIDHLLIESIDIDEIDIEDKAEVFDRLREINLLRRDYKILNKFRQSCQNQISNIIGNSEKMLNIYEKQTNINNDIFKKMVNRDRQQIKHHMVDEFEYESFKDRMRMMKDLEKMYDKVIHFPEKRSIVCYNKCV